MKIKERISGMIFSRKFIALIIGVVAYYVTPDRFDSWALIACIGIYTGANVIDSISGKSKKAE